MTLESYLNYTNSKQSDLIDSLAYMWASKIFKYKEDYTLLYIKPKPKYLPSFLYKWLLKKLLVLAEFRNN